MKARIRRHSLVTRLALLSALLSFLAVATLGYAFYRGLETQLVLRDDAALLQRVDQIRTLMRDVDVIDLIHQKPQLFANMLGNREALLVVKFPGEAPLIEVNPGNIKVPDLRPIAADAALTLDEVQHSEKNGTPFIVVSAAALTSDLQRHLQITTGRLMTERTRLLRAYRDRIVVLAAIASVVTAFLAFWINHRGLSPLRRLVRETAAIDIRNLSVRIDGHLAPRELLPLIEGFNGMLDRLETSFTQLSQVSADMAHDVRTPIGNMLGQIEVALGQRRSADYYEKVLGSNFEELQRLSKMADNMLFLARAEHANHAIDRQTLKVREELQRIVEYFEGPAEERRVRLAIRGDGLMWADPSLLRRSMANLLANAVRYADAGSEIVLSAHRASEGVTLSVENTGPTIGEHHLARLFDRFYRVDASRNDSSSASGLGLAIVRSIMSLHQGRWSASSAAGVTRITLFFPAEAAIAGAGLVTADGM